VFFGDIGGNFYALDAANGRLSQTGTVGHQPPSLNELADVEHRWEAVTCRRQSEICLRFEKKQVPTHEDCISAYLPKFFKAGSNCATVLAFTTSVLIRTLRAAS
jgi:hypothetical protein